MFFLMRQMSSYLSTVWAEPSCRKSIFGDSVSYSKSLAGYKNQKRDQIMQLIVRRVQATALENRLYPDEDLVETALRPSSEARGQDHIAGTGEDNSTEDDVADNNNQQSITSPHNDNESLPNTRAKARATALQLRENPAARAPRKKKKSKSTPPTSITQVGSYIRATNVFFEQLHRADVSSLGEPPTMREPTYHLLIYCEPTYHLPFYCEPTYHLPIYCASIHHAYCSPLYHASTDFYFHTVQVLSSLQPPTHHHLLQS
jgi:hypothetical protein